MTVFMNIASSGSRWIAVNGEGGLWGSDDGINWVENQKLSQFQFRDCIYAGGKFYVIFGTSGSIYSSDDGKNFELFTSLGFTLFNPKLFSRGDDYLYVYGNTNSFNVDVSWENSGIYRINTGDKTQTKCVLEIETQDLGRLYIFDMLFNDVSNLYIAYGLRENASGTEATTLYLYSSDGLTFRLNDSFPNLDNRRLYSIRAHAAVKDGIEYVVYYPTSISVSEFPGKVIRCSDNSSVFTTIALTDEAKKYNWSDVLIYPADIVNVNSNDGVIGIIKDDTLSVNDVAKLPALNSFWYYGGGKIFGFQSSIYYTDDIKNGFAEANFGVIPLLIFSECNVEDQPDDDSMTNIAFGAYRGEEKGTFIGNGKRGLFLSDDGVNFEYSDMPESVGTLAATIYGDGRFLVTSNGTGMVLTAERNNYTIIKNGNDLSSGDYDAKNKRFLVKDSSVYISTLYAVDHGTGEIDPLYASDKAIGGICCNGDLILIGGSNYIKYSTNGLSFNDCSIPSIDDAHYGFIIFKNNLYTALDIYGGILWSEDGLNWQSGTFPSHSSDNYICGITHAKDLYFVSGRNTSGTNRVLIATSQDGKNFFSGDYNLEFSYLGQPAAGADRLVVSNVSPSGTGVKPVSAYYPSDPTPGPDPGPDPGPEPPLPDGWLDTGFRLLEIDRTNNLVTITR